MKQYCCDRCGVPLERSVPDYYRINKDNGEDVDDYYDDDFFIGISAVYYFGDGLKADLCKKCTIEIAKEFIRASADATEKKMEALDAMSKKSELNENKGEGK